MSLYPQAQEMHKVSAGDILYIPTLGVVKIIPQKPISPDSRLLARRRIGFFWSPWLTDITEFELSRGTLIEEDPV